MLGCTQYEARAIMDGRAVGIVRKYDTKMGCPHAPNSQIVLTLEGNDNDGKKRQVAFAKATVISVRPGTVGRFRKDKMLAQQDGFDNEVAWYTHFSNMLYKGIGDDVKVHHITFRIEKMEKKAG